MEKGGAKIESRYVEILQRSQRNELHPLFPEGVILHNYVSIIAER